ncbi:MAG: caspase family protein [Methyloceanibacter sp.]|nr:caspase family protein [Methyloceanibacter sp.]
MAGRLGTVQGLVLGLVLVVLGLVALAEALNAEPWGERRARTAQGAPPVFLSPAPPGLQARPARAGSTPIEATTPEQVEAIARVQACLAELGYYKGAIDGKRGRATWTAYWHFKHDHKLGAYSDILAEPVRQKLNALCKLTEETAALEPTAQPLDQPEVEGALASPEPDSEESVALASPESDSEEGVALEPRVRLDIDCLPEDLIAVLHRAHGPGVAVKSCEKACLPSPKGLPQAQLDELQTKNGVVWCRACVPIDGHLALDDVQRIERAGNVQLCATPPRQLPRHGSGAGDGLRSYTRVRELYRALPPAAEDPDAVAVIIGNRSYDKLPPSGTSYNDADAIYSFLTEHLGYRPDNVIDVRDAKKADLERLFGAEPGLEGDLSRLVQSQPNAKVLVYYSGHGATDGAQSETYLLPVDTEAFRDELGGYKLSTLYANLARLDARSALVLLETEYGRDHGAYVLPPNLPEMMNTALPRSPVPGLTVLAASDRGQRTLVDLTYDIGLFTRYLIEGLAGDADLAPVGNGDGELDSAEIYVFTATLVDLAARKSFGLLQHPVYSSAATSVLTSARTAPSGSN